MDVRCQIFRHVEQPQKSLTVHAWGGFTSPIPWRDLLVPGSLVERSDRLLDTGVPDNQEPPALHISAAGRTHARL
jgi:hypothetical protein